MCFENLPIEFDAQGNAQLKPGVKNPYDYQTRTLEEREQKLREIAAKNGQLADVDFDPVTRVAGALAFHSTVDLEARKVVDTNAMATLFRSSTSPQPSTEPSRSWMVRSNTGPIRASSGRTPSATPSGTAPAQWHGQRSWWR